MRSYYPKSKSYAELLTIADLEEKQETFIAKLSGGQRDTRKSKRHFLTVLL